MSIKVLTIDDDPNMTDLLKVLLKNNKFEIFAENSSSKGIEAARRVQPDVIILDLMMPDIDGWEVCKQIRSFSQTPILILSVINQMDKLIRVLHEGANAYITKPVTKKELTACLLGLIENTGTTK